MEGRTIVVSKGGTPHRCDVIWADKVTDDIRKRVRGKNSRLFVSMHESVPWTGPTDDSELEWEAKQQNLSKEL